jgi:hypothetical protein
LLAQVRQDLPPEAPAPNVDTPSVEHEGVDD